jgi:hypothetical protein
MKGKNLVRRASFAVVLAAALVAGTSAASRLTAGDPPECDCIVYNYPEPGEHQAGYVVEDGEYRICFMDECSIIETK